MGYDNYTLILGEGIQDRGRVLSALEKTAQECGWRFIQEKVYGSGSGDETKQTATRVYLSGPLLKKVTLQMSPSDKIDRIDILRGMGYGFAKDLNILAYTEKFAHNLHTAPVVV